MYRNENKFIRSKAEPRFTTELTVTEIEKLERRVTKAIDANLKSMSYYDRFRFMAPYLVKKLLW